ncbi:MAG: hypothetical protein JWO80_4950 [Bryobacterales bacterium]|nr:hypothetical protein [Bryobacterales bacterium]
MDLRAVSRRLLALFFLTSLAHADTAAFDLVGPSIDIKVERKGKTLPISQVPNLQAGDRIWIHPALPRNQSAHYLLVAAFLRGATNPPPENWFTRSETWSKKNRDEGIFVTVPDGAEQAVIFLAPETAGDFSTLRSAVRGRPGSFVRAIQDLEQASLDRSRLDTYLAAINRTAETDTAAVHDHSVLLARSLNMRLDEDCFKKQVEQQAACLTQKSDNLVMNDGHSQSMVGALTQGPASDLIGQITFTPTAGSGYFSPYVGAIVDMGRILDSLHTAQYQYIPALGLPKQDQLQLKLNSPPSFHNPKSVIVVALPPVKPEEQPPLRAVDPQQASCVQITPLVLQVSGAPLAFSSDLLHNLVLHVQGKSGPGIDLPARADAVRGGYLIDTKALAGTEFDGVATEGVLRGYWGFDPFTGPTFKLQNAHPAAWTIPQTETASLSAGREHAFHLHADSAACVNQVTIKHPNGSESKVNWKVSRPDEVEVKVPAGGATPGTLTMAVKQAGLNQPDEVKISIYAETGQLDRFVIIPGVQQAILHGSRLDEVASIEVSGVHFTPSPTPGGQGELPFAAENANATESLSPDSKLSAQVVLKDGRKLEVPAIVESPRPSVTLLSKRVETGSVSTASAIHLTNQDELPLDGHLSFSLKTGMPKVFPRGEKIEISATDDSLHVMLSIADGSLTLQDPHTVLATLDPSKSFGNSAFGPLRFRPVDERGVKGDWQPLATLVRVPSLKELHCPEDATQQCTLSGTNLFLLDCVAADPQFTVSVPVPEGFVDSTLNVPHPTGPIFYVKLRDNPKDVNLAMLPIIPDKAPQ